MDAGGRSTGTAPRSAGLGAALWDTPVKASAFPAAAGRGSGSMDTAPEGDSGKAEGSGGAGKQTAPGKAVQPADSHQQGAAEG